MASQPKEDKLQEQTSEYISQEEVQEEGHCPSDTEDNVEKEDLNALLELKQQEIEEYKRRWLRSQADLDNYRKRIQREMAENSLYAAEPLAKDLLPVLDNFERALSSIEDKEDPRYQGVHLIYQQLINLLEKHYIKEIEALGQPFDPNFHDAVMTVENDEHAEDTVVEVLQKGYIYHSKVIRPSMVKVSKNS